MYTQCPECETYFRVTAEDLAAADGEVRCSRCDAIFDAGARLLTPAQEDALAARDPHADPDAASASADGASGFATAAAPAPATVDLFGDALPFDAGDAADAALADPDLDPAALEGIATGDAPAIDALAPGAEPFGPGAPLGVELPTGASPLLAAAGRPRPRLGPWLAACAALALLLGLQAVHAARASLARDPRLGPGLVATYRALRLPLQPPTDLARLDVQRTDVTSHPVYRDVLYITAVVVNEADFPQPLPLLRVRLDDRWGEPVGVRIFRPEEYLRRAEPSGRAEPGRTYPVALEVVDPGSEAVGYALTPCLPQGETLVCLGDG